MKTVAVEIPIELLRALVDFALCEIEFLQNNENEIPDTVQTIKAYTELEKNLTAKLVVEL